MTTLASFIDRFESLHALREIIDVVSLHENYLELLFVQFQLVPDSIFNLLQVLFVSFDLIAKP